MQKYIDEIVLNRKIEVWTDNGWKEIKSILKTKLFKIYYILFESGKFLECADEHILIKKDYSEIFVKDLKIGDIIIGENQDEIVFDILETDEEENMYDIALDEHHLFFTNGVLSHNSQYMVNLAARQVLNGYNVVVLTLEMSQDMFAQRFDSVFTNLDINKLYYFNDTKTKFINRIKEIKEKENRGNLFIKEFPTGKASVNDYRIYLRELLIRGIKPDIIYVDYLNIMKPSYKNKTDLYFDVKTISEEVRALGLEFDCPIVSVSQLNREGSTIDFNDVTMFQVAESSGINFSADSIMIFGKDFEKLVYESEIWFKIVKNRLGGRIGTIDKIYFDINSLKMYDPSEFDIWIKETIDSGDERKLYEKR